MNDELGGIVTLCNPKQSVEIGGAFTKQSRRPQGTSGPGRRIIKTRQDEFGVRNAITNSAHKNIIALPIFSKDNETLEIIKMTLKLNDWKKLTSWHSYKADFPLN